MDIKRALENIVGAENVTNVDYDLIAYSRDMSPYPPKLPDFVVLPGETQEISDIMRLANRTKTPVYVKGGGTGAGGMNIAREGGIMIDLRRMDKILEINEDRNTITCQAGCGVYKAVKALRKKGYRFALLPEFGSVVTMGGWTSVTASGINQISHGYQWDSLIGMEVVLPTGEIVRTGQNAWQNCDSICRHGAFGDLSGIFIGSMGGFGIITEVTYSIFPIEDTIEYIHLGYDSWDSVIKALHKFMKPIHLIQELGLVDAAIGMVMGAKLKSRLILIIQCAGTKEEVEYRANVVRKIGRETGSVEEEAPIGQLLHDNAALLNAWFKMFGGYDAIGSFGVALEALPEFYRIIQEVSRKRRLNFVFYSWFTRQAAVPFPAFLFREPEQLETMRQARMEIYEKMTQIKNISPAGYFAPWPDLSHKLRPTYYELVRKIKRALDPNNILNPGLMPY